MIEFPLHIHPLYREHNKLYHQIVMQLVPQEKEINLNILPSSFQQKYSDPKMPLLFYFCHQQAHCVLLFHLKIQSISLAHKNLSIVVLIS